MQISLNLSTAFHNKVNLTGETAAFGSSFHPARVTPDELAAHIRAGRAWTMHAFTGNRRRGADWQSSQVLALDLDECPLTAEEIAALPFIAENAYLVYPSPSSTPEQPKTRVLFILSEPVDQAERWQALQRGLLAYFHNLKPDAKCKDLARLFYGSDKPGMIVLGNLLPLAVAGGLTAAEAERDEQIRLMRQQVPVKPINPASSKAERIAARRVDRALSELASAAAGRHDMLYKKAAYLFGMVKGGWPLTDGEVERGLLEACARNGYIAAKGEHEVRRVIDDAHRAAAPVALEIVETDRARRRVEKKPLTERVKPVDLPTLAAGLTVNLRYISELPLEALAGKGAVLGQSPINTGKTELVKRVIAAQRQRLGYTPSVLVLVHREALARNTAERLEIECYKDIKPEWLRSAPQLVICYNSIEKLAAVGEKLPHYDLLIIDEIEQVHQHLGGGTFRAGAAKRAYEVLRQLVKEAGQVIGLDAHAGHISQSWLEGLKGRENTLTIVNTYQVQRGALAVHSSKDTVIDRAFKLAALNEGPVAIPTSSKTLARRIERLAVERFGASAVRLICQDNSGNEDTQAFIQEINQALPGLKVLIYTPSLGTGVDITAPVRAVCGVFRRQPLAAPDFLQMMGRCRNAAESHVFVESAEGRAETDAAAIYGRYLANAERTRLECHFDEYGVLAVSDVQKSILKLQSMIEAERNRSANDLLSHFVALATASGYQVAFQDGENRAIAAALKDASERIAADDKEAILAAEPVSYEQLEQHRNAGTLSPEVRAGHERFKIEDTVGQGITPDVYDDLHTASARDRLRRFTDLEEDESELAERDRQQALDEHLLTRRGYFTMRRKLANLALRMVFGDEGLNSKAELTGGEIEARFGDFISLHRTDLRNFYGWRADQSKQPVAVLRWLLKQSGIALSSRQVMRDGERFYVYYIDQAHLEKMRAYAKTRRAHLLALKAAAQAEKAHYLKPGFKESSPVVSVPTQQRGIPPAPGWRLSEIAHMPSPAVSYAALAQAGKPINPFAARAV